jgi:hypothetical protein
MNDQQLYALLLGAFDAALVGPRSAGWFAGLLETLAEIDATTASWARSERHSTIAAHLGHTVFGLRAVRLQLEHNVHPNWDEEWKIRSVTETEWQVLVAETQQEYQRLRQLLAAHDLESPALAKAMLDQALHVAYHVGAIRQMLVQRTNG